MSLQTFFDSFALITDASSGVQKLRDLVLQLAVEGKLDTHNQSDESASKLLERIQTKRNQLLGENRTSQNRALSLNDKANYALPFNWKLVPLGEVQVFTNGYAFKSGDYQPEGIGIVRIGNIGNGEISTLNMRHVSPEFLKSLDPKYQVKKGDLLIAMSGATTGKLGFNKTNDIILLNQRVGKIQFIEVSPAYGFFFLTTKISENLNSSSGSAIPNLSTEQINNIPFPLPPLEEQKRIVAKVDELMRLCDELEARQQARRESRVRLNNATLAPINKAASLASEEFEQASARLAKNFDTLYDSAETVCKLRSTILQLAIQGKLVPQDPLDEPASALLGKIAQEKTRLTKEKKIRQREPSFPKEIESPFKLANGWLWARFGNVTINRDGERIPIEKSLRQNRHGIYDYYGASGVIDKVDDYLFDKPLLLIGEDGANLINRATPIAFIAKGKYWVNNHAHVLDSVSLECLEYLEVFINAIDLRPYITGTAQPKMNQAKMNSLLVAFAPEEEQKRIVAKVNQLMALCDELETKLRQAEIDSEKLMNAAIQHVLESIVPIRTSELGAAFT